MVKEIERIKKLLDDFNKLDEQTKNKLIEGVKVLAFLVHLAGKAVAKETKPG